MNENANTANAQSSPPEKHARVLLIAPRWGQVYGSFRSLSRRFNFQPPMGLCSISASLRDNGFLSSVIDAEAGAASDEEIIEKIKSGFGYVGITATTPIYEEAVALSVKIKKDTGATILLGGPHATILRAEALHKSGCFDFLVCGEGERTLVSFLNAREEARELASIPGLVYERNGEIVDTGKAALEQNLDSLPFPARSHLVPEQYLWTVPGRGIVPTTSVMYSRGCPFECTFCSQRHMYGRTVRFRSPENMVEELKEIISEYPYRHFVFLDDTLTSNRDKAAALFEAILTAGLQFTFEGETRANLLDPEITALMKRAGLVRMNIGIESGDPEILKTLKAGITLEDVKKALKLLKGFNIETRGTVIIGNPFETRKTVIRTIRFLANLRELDQPYINIAAPYPGTKLREMVLAGEGGAKLIKKNFSDLKRYGNAVMEVNDLDMETIVKMQARGLRSAYLKPRRLWYNLKRAGIITGMQGALDFLKIARTP